MSNENRNKNQKRIVWIALLLLPVLIVGLVFGLFFDHHKHALTQVPGVDATCTQSGTKSYYTCSGCDGLFADAEGNIKINAPEVIDALGHQHSEWSIKTAPTYKDPGVIGSKCAYCDQEKTAEVPNISKDNGYKRICFGKISVWEYSHEGVTLTFQTEEVVQTYSLVVADNDPFANCHGTFTDGGNGTAKYSNKYGVFYEYTKGATFTTTIIVPEETDVAFAIRFCSRDGVEFDLSKAVTSVTVNGEADGAIRNEGSFTTGGWSTNDATSVTVATLALKPGENVISFTIGNDTPKDLNIAGIEFLSAVSVKLAPAKHTEVYDPAEAPSCVAVGHTAGSHCATCKKELVERDEIASLGGHKWNGNTCKTCNATRFEAETAKLQTNSDKVGVGLEKTLEKCNYPSGGAYVWNIQKADECSLTFYVYASKDTKAVLSYCLGLSNQYKASDLFNITVNGVACDYDEPVMIIPSAADAGVTKYFGWSEFEVATIDLKQGENVIVLTKNIRGLNLDYIALRSDATLRDSREVSNNGHKYSGWTVITAPTYKAAGKIGAYCEYCRNYKTVSIPAVSAERGYTRVKEGLVSVWTYTYGNEKIQINVTEDSKAYLFGVADNDPFADCKGAVVDAGSGVNKHSNTYGTFYQETKGATFTTRIKVSKATEVALIVRVCSTNGETVAYNKAITSVLLNGKKDGVVINEGKVTTTGWYTNTASGITIAYLNLKEGENTISFTMGTETKKNLNIAGFEILAMVPVELAPEKHTVVTDAAVAPSCVNIGLTEGKHCSVCGEIFVKQEVIDSLGGHQWDGTDCEICGAKKFEAETSKIETESPNVGAGLEPGRDIVQCGNPSGGAYVWNIQKADECSLTFYVYASKDTRAVLSYCLGLSNQYKASDLFKITVNGIACDYDDPVVTIPSAEDAGATKYFGWTEFEVATIDLKQGENVIVLTKNTRGLNFDYIALRCDATLQDSREVANNGHNHSNWTVVTAPTYEAAGKIGAYCEYCRDYKTVDIPAVSAANGYTKVKSALTSVWNYTYDGETIEIQVAEDPIASSFNVADSDPFADCKGTVVDGGFYTDGSVVEKITNGYGVFYQKTKGATFTTTITVTEATEIEFIIKVCSTNGKEFAISDVVTSVLLNGVTDGVTVHDGTFTTVGWYTDSATKIAVATLSLQEGENVISFTMGTETEKDLNVAGVEFIAAVPVEVAPAKHTYDWTHTLTTAPTYTAEGQITSAGVCSVCGDSNGTANATIPAVSVENGYTKIFGGVVSRWAYTYDGQTVTVDIAEDASSAATYSYGVEAFYIGLNGEGNPIFKSGYKHSNGTYSTTFFGEGTNKTFTTTITVPETTSVKLILKCGRKASTYSYSSALSSLKINGSTEGVLSKTTESVVFDGWTSWKDWEIATILLEKGTNTISFKSESNINWAGIGFVSTEEIHMHTDVIDAAVEPTCTQTGLTEGMHCSVCNEILVAQTVVDATGHSYDPVLTITTMPSYTAEGELLSTAKCSACEADRGDKTFTLPVVSEENGWVRLITGVLSRWQYTCEDGTITVDLVETPETTTYSFGVEAWYADWNDGAPIGAAGFKHTNATWNSTNSCYGKANKTYTTTVVVSEPTTVTLILECARNKAKPFYSDTGAEHVLDWIKVNGSTDAVVYDKDSRLNSSNWYGWKDCEVATLFLEAGTNVITFDTSTNTNFKGIGFKAASGVTVELAEDKIDIDLMSFNIRQDTDSGAKAWANRKDDLIQMVIGYNPSVICFQEVDKNQGVDLTSGLAGAGYEVVWYARQTGSNPEGLAVAYKTDTWEKVSESRFWLSETPDVQSKGWGATYFRICVNVLLKHKETGAHLNVFTVHLDFGATPKVNGIKLIMDRAAAAGYPAYIAGDFNDALTGPAYLAAAEQYRDVRVYAPTSDFCTTCAYWGKADDTSTDGIIDHCFVSKENFVANTFKVLRTRLDNNFYPSDHFAIMSQVSLLVPHTHKEVTDAAVAPTCTATGLTEGSHCSSCGEVLVAQEAVAASGHTEETDAAVAPTCTETGLTEGKHCSVCSEVLVAQETVDALGHSEAFAVGTAPTYTSEGTLTCTCDRCGDVSVTLPVISAENGYVKVFGGVVSRWKYVCNEQTFVFDVTENVETTAINFDANAAFTSPAGSNTSTWNSGGYYGNTDGDTFSVTITVSERTAVEFIIQGGSKGTRSYSGETIVPNMTLNDSQDGVILTTVKTQFAGWTSFVDFKAAVLILEAGENTITFKPTANLNIKGIKFIAVSTIEIGLKG